MVLVLLLAVAGVWWVFNRDSGYAVGECVKEGRDSTVLDASCDEKDAYRIVKKVDQDTDCDEPDATVTLERGDRVEVLCLKKVQQG